MSQEIPLYLKMLIKNFVEEISKNPQIKAMLDEIRTKLIEMKDGRPTSMQGFVDIEINVIESGTKTVLDYIHPQDREEDDDFEDDDYDEE